MLVSLVYARSRNGVIGRDGDLPWTIPSDLKRFKETTLGKPIVMGRKTWDSLPRKPLPGRMNIVMTRRGDFVPEGVTVARNVDAALALAGDVAEVCVIGGGEIYRQFFDRAGRVYETEIDLEVEGDTFAPKLDPDVWRETSATDWQQGPKDSARFITRVFDRVS